MNIFTFLSFLNVVSWLQIHLIDWQKSLSFCLRVILILFILVLGPQSGRSGSDQGGGWKIVWSGQTNDLITFSSRLISFGREWPPNESGQRTMTEIESRNGKKMHLRWATIQVAKLNINYKKLNCVYGRRQQQQKGVEHLLMLLTLLSPDFSVWILLVG